MSTQEIIKTLKKSTTKAKLKKMGIKHMWLVGSFSRNQQTLDSDVDLVYEKNDPKNFDLFDRLDVKEYIENLIDREVDLISPKYIHPFIKKKLLSSLIEIF